MRRVIRRRPGRVGWGARSPSARCGVPLPVHAAGGRERTAGRAPRSQPSGRYGLRLPGRARRLRHLERRQRGLPARRRSRPGRVAETASLVVLGAMGTGIAFLIQYGLVRDAGATVASMVTYLVPVISTVAGVAILGEDLKWHQPVGAVVILLGAALSQRTSTRSE
ncbi:DMT family transporter [Streptomyces sp. SDT5-1]|uniref:DMT family transporter n=1 Tax=Streptomyces sp. SDT5-1 TaxID=3406418 RepID=UPI003FD21299